MFRGGIPGMTNPHPQSGYEDVHFCWLSNTHCTVTTSDSRNSRTIYILSCSWEVSQLDLNGVLLIQAVTLHYEEKEGSCLFSPAT